LDCFSRGRGFKIPLAICSLKSFFPPLAGRQRSFAFSAAKQLASFALAKVAQTSFAVPVLSLRSTGIPENTQAPLAKSSIRSHNRQGHFSWKFG